MPNIGEIEDKLTDVDVVEKSITSDIEEISENLSQNFTVTDFDELESSMNNGDYLETASMLIKSLSWITDNIRESGEVDMKSKVVKFRKNWTYCSSKLKELDGEFDSTGKISLKEKVSSFFESIKKSISIKPKSIVKKELKSSLAVWKEDDGTWRFIGIYTNNFQDVDKDIVTKAAHEKFVKGVDEGKYPKPVLVHWHEMGTAWGQVDGLALDDSGFMVAVGTVLKGHEKEAEILSKMDDVGMSHMMIDVVRNERNPLYIDGYQTVEISDLPLWAAANKYTDFGISKKEASMALPEQKKDYLKAIGITDETISAIENKVSSKAAEATTAGVLSKEIEVPAPIEIETTTVVEVEAQKPVETTTEANSEVAKTMSEMAIALKSIAEVVANLNTKVTELELKKEVVVEKEKEEKAPETSVQTVASIAAFVAKQMRAIGDKETALRKNDPLMKSKPVEAKEENPGAQIMTGIPVLDATLNSMVAPRQEE